MDNKFLKNNKGFSLIEVLVSVVTFSFIVLAIVSILLSTNTANQKTKAEREVLGNAQRSLERISYEIRSAEGIYRCSMIPNPPGCDCSTGGCDQTLYNQLTLITSKYLPDNRKIDFFICEAPLVSGGTYEAICFKKDSEGEPIILTSSSVRVTDLSFSEITTGDSPSIKISLTVAYDKEGITPPITLTSTVSLRNN